MKHKIQDSGFKIYALCFVVVIALAFLFAPMNAVYAAGEACSCATGSTCPATCIDPAAPVCVGGTCQAVFSSATAVGPFEIKPPTGATSFSAIMCAVITFFSQTILPPIAVLMMLVVGFLFMVGGQMPQKAIAARKALLYVIAGVILLLLAPGILAIIADITESEPIIGSCPTLPMTMDGIVKTIANLINWFAWFVSVTSVAMGLYAGLLYLTARGDSSQVLKATKVFSYTIIGIAVAVVSFSIILLTRTLFGL